MKRMLGLLCAVLLLLSSISGPALTAGESGAHPFEAMDRSRDKALSSMLTPKSGEEDSSSQTQKAQAQEKLTRAEARYIVKFKDDVALQEIYDGIRDYPFILIGDSAHRTFTFPADVVEAVTSAFGDKIGFVEEDALIRVDSFTSDVYADQQWALSALRLPAAWTTTIGSDTVFVAVIDSGWDTYHEDLVSADIRQGYDYILDRACTWDSTGHGTSVTGIIAATPNNGIGIAGVCWNVAIVPLLVTYTDGTMLISNTVEAIYDAADMGCDVINMSFGGPVASQAQREAVQYARSRGCILVSAAGNDGSASYSYPASYEGVISVAAINSSLDVSGFSQKNSAVAVSAPGEGVISTADPYHHAGHRYVSLDGTSFAAPYVAGIAALVRSIDDTVDTSKFAKALAATCADRGAAGKDDAYGFGVIDAKAMLDYFAQPGNVTYTVGFLTQGGSAVDSVRVNSGAGLPMPETPVLPGHLFTGWYRDAACTVPWNFDADVVTADMLLYAGWTTGSYTVTFDSRGGSAVAPVAVDRGATIPMPPAPARYGYTFTGWYRDTFGTAPWNFDSGVTGGMTLYAGWRDQLPGSHLEAISLSAGRLNRPFSAGSTSYTLTLGQNEGAVTITPAKGHDGAAMTIDGKKVAGKTVKLANGKSATVKIKVTWGRKTTTYKISVKRAKSTANTLSALTASAGTWSQAFDPAVTSYRLTLPEKAAKVTLRATRASGVASVSPSQKTYTLKNGQTLKATFKVRAQSGAVRTYTVTITRAKSTNANLATLKSSVKGSLAPGFQAAVTDYTVVLPAKTASTTLSVKGADKLSSVRINGAKKTSLKVALANGQSKTVTVVVTAQSGNTRSYTITLTRK